jgi:hypothetical protein
MIDKYDLINNTNEIRNLTYPINHIFVVTNIDYDNGYARRFFVQKSNENIVIEVDEQNYYKISKNIYIKVDINWYLIGVERNVYKNGNLYEIGIFEQNLKEVNEACKTMPLLKSIIKNYTQYFKLKKN